MSEIEGAVIVHFDQNGEISYKVFGGEAVRLFIVDERAPNDRVFEWLRRNSADEFRAVIPKGSEIGSDQDARHQAIAARIIAATEGRPHLGLVTPDA